MSTHHTWGIIEKSGDLASNSSSNVQSTRRKEKGEYEIMFSTHFKTTPAVVATAIHHEESPRKVLNVVVDKETYTDSTYDSGKKGVVVLIQTPDGDPNDNKFGFLAIGTW